MYCREGEVPRVDSLYDPRLRIHQSPKSLQSLEDWLSWWNTILERGGEAGRPTEVGSRGGSSSIRYIHTKHTHTNTPWQTELVVGVLVPHRKDR